MAEKKGIKIAAQNRKAFHDYFVEDRYEAGIELKGTEVKSIRAGTLNLKDSYVIVKNGEANVLSMHISPYDKGNIFNHDPDRPKKLLLHKREIGKLYSAHQAGRLRADPAERLLQGRAREGRSRCVQG